MSAETYGRALAELDSLREGSVVLDSGGDAWQKQDVRWTSVVRGTNTELMGSNSLAILTPLTVVYRAPRPDITCPDCRDGKHGACIGSGWDDEKDAPADCECACRDVPGAER